MFDKAANAIQLKRTAFLVTGTGIITYSYIGKIVRSLTLTVEINELKMNHSPKYKL